MINISGIGKENPNIEIVKQDNNFGFQILQYKQDLSVMPWDAVSKYFMAKMNCKQRMVLVRMTGQRTWTLSAGAMNWMGGNIQATTGIKGAGDLLGKMVKGKVTGESAIKPEYKGQGILVTEPTYRHLIPLYTSNWGGAVCINDGYYEMSSGAKLEVRMIRSMSGAALGGEGLFNLCAVGQEGVVIIESPRPMEELITIDVQNDTFQIDGDMAICWSDGLQLTVERVTKSLVGSAASGEGLVNTFRGTGRILMAPFKETRFSPSIQI